MWFKDLVTVSLRQVIRQRRRLQGVTLAVGLGVASLITILTMCQEIKKNFSKDLDLIGGVTIIRANFDNAQNKHFRPQWFRESTIDALGRTAGVKGISLATMKSGYAHRHGDSYDFMLMAVDHAFWQVLNLSALSGHLFGADEVNGHKKECVLGSELAKKIFGTTQVTGQTLEINQELYRISGVLRAVPTDNSLDYAAFLPLTTARDRLEGVFLTDRLYLRCKTWDDIPVVAEAIPQIIKAHQSLDRLQVYVRWEGLTRIQQLTWWVELLVYLAVSLTFILGGTGIWNVSMAAVTTRTREIGLKKAMGAEDRDILAQLLVEALCLSLIGAVMGAALGRIVIEILAHLICSRPPESLFFLSLSLGLLLSLFLGVGAGLYPSFKASRMEVVSAIRFE